MARQTANRCPVHPHPRVDNPAHSHRGRERTEKTSTHPVPTQQQRLPIEYHPCHRQAHCRETRGVYWGHCGNLAALQKWQEGWVWHEGGHAGHGQV